MTHENYGYCPICKTETKFISKNDWFRDNLICIKCKSIPRERSIAYIINKIFGDDLKSLKVHESSPALNRSITDYLDKKTKYSYSQYFPNQKTGVNYKGFRNENLEKLTFGDDTFDIFITQDVFEHIYRPEKAFKEIARVLKPSGKLISTVPLVNKFRDSKPRIKIDKDNKIEYLAKKDYHGNPVSSEGSLVTFNWGYDIVDYIDRSTGMRTILFVLDIIDFGLRAEYLEVLVSFK